MVGAVTVIVNRVRLMEERRAMYLNVNEMFGPTIQGEGRHAGRLASFLRLSGCNLSCSWCDTPYTWDWSRFDRSAETHRMGVEEVAEKLESLPGRIVVSGGEPLSQARGLAGLMRLLPSREWDVETNGTRPLGPTEGLWSTVTTSPKIIPSARQDAQAHSLSEDVLLVADVKFVVADKADLEAVTVWLDEHPQVTRDRVWLMPEGTSHEALTARTPFVIDAAVRLGVNFTSRLHVYGWADVRGH